MRAIGWIDADLVTNGRGLPSRCLADLGGRPVLARVAEGALACPTLREVVVTCMPRDRQGVEAALAGLPCRVLAVDAPDVPNRALRRRARKWAGHSWRGGIASTYVFDEEGNLAALYAALVAADATHGVKLSASGPFVDREMVEGMLSHIQTHGQGHDLCLSAAPPGLNYEVYEKEAVKALAAARDTMRSSLAIHPQEVTPDPTAFDFWYPLDVDIVSSAVRLLVDSARGEALVAGVLAAKGESILRAPAREVLRAVRERPELEAGRLPEEVEVEVCSDSRVEGDLRPVVRREVSTMALATVEAIAEQLAGEDDVRWTFGGIGDPLLHPRLAEAVAIARQKGACGIHVATSGAAMTRERAAGLAAAGVDVVTVGPFPAPEAVEALLAEKKEGLPLVLVEWVKVKEREAEFEAFYDAWAAKADGVVVRGSCDYAGQAADRGVMHLLPGERGVCERLRRRMTVLPNGDVTMCEMDYLGRHVIGNVHRDRLEGLWTGRCAELRRAHARGDFGAFPLCGACKDWASL